MAWTRIRTWVGEGVGYGAVEEKEMVALGSSWRHLIIYCLCDSNFQNASDVQIYGKGCEVWNERNGEVDSASCITRLVLYVERYPSGKYRALKIEHWVPMRTSSAFLHQILAEQAVGKHGNANRTILVLSNSRFSAASSTKEFHFIFVKARGILLRKVLLRD